MACWVILYYCFFSAVELSDLGVLSSPRSTHDTNERTVLEILTLALALALAVLSGVWVVSSIAGCVGTFTQSKKLLEVITIFFKLGFLLEIVFCSLAVYYHTKVKTETNKLAEWMSFIQHYHEDPNLRFTLDSIQSTLRCCAFDGYEDWDHNPLFSCSSPQFKTCRLPVTCCDGLEKENRNCEYKIRHTHDNGIERQPEKFIHTRGCLAIIQDWYKYNLLVILISCILLAVVQLIIILFIKRVVRGKENMEERTETTEQDLILLSEQGEGKTNRTCKTEIHAQTSGVKVQGAFTIKIVMQALIDCLAWRRRHSTKEEMI